MLFPFDINVITHSWLPSIPEILPFLIEFYSLVSFFQCFRFKLGSDRRQVVLTTFIQSRLGKDLLLNPEAEIACSHPSISLYIVNLVPARNHKSIFSLQSKLKNSFIGKIALFWVERYKVRLVSLTDLLLKSSWCILRNFGWKSDIARRHWRYFLVHFQRINFLNTLWRSQNCSRRSIYRNSYKCAFLPLIYFCLRATWKVYSLILDYFLAQRECFF